MHTAQNQSQLMIKTILLLQNFVPSKMSDECEHSESKLYYPHKLCDAELIHSKSKERNSTLLTNEEVHNFLRSQQQAIEKTTSLDELSDN